MPAHCCCCCMALLCACCLGGNTLILSPSWPMWCQAAPPLDSRCLDAMTGLHSGIGAFTLVLVQRASKTFEELLTVNRVS